MLTDHSRAVIAVNTVFPALAAFFVLLRLHARRLKDVSFRLDDYVIILALTFTLGQGLPFAYCAVKGGMGQHIADLSDEEITVFGKVTYWTQLPYVLAVTTIKVSILLFYRTVFVTPKFRLAVNIFLTVIAAWTIAFFFASVFQAWPISWNWDQDQPGGMINEFAMYQALACSELAFDIITLCMPWVVVWKLHMRTAKKWAVCGIFTMGGLVCISTAVRIYYFTRGHLAPGEDFTYDTYNIFIWTAIEPCMGVICACLPTLGPLFQGGHSAESFLVALRSYARIGSRRSRSSLDSSHGRSKMSGHSSNDNIMSHRMYRTSDFGKMPDDAVILTAVRARKDGDDDSEEATHDGIMVSRDVESVVRKV